MPAPLLGLARVGVSPRLLPALAFLGATAWTTSGCTGADAIQVAPATLVIGVAQPKSSPGSADSSLDRIAALLERAGLLRLERNGRLEPSLAERVDVSADGRTWTLTLNPT